REAFANITFVQDLRKCWPKPAPLRSLSRGMEPSMKILLAEDDLKMAEYLIAGLVESGHSVDHVADGRDALSYCLYNDCDMAILDRMMPGMDGLSVLKALRAARKDLP